MADWILRPMEVLDLDRILEIEKSLFASPWSRKAFESELIRPGGVTLTAEADRRPVGYAVGWAVTDEIHIANLAVALEWQRRGIGEALVNAVLESHPEAAWAGLEVRRSNAPAMALYKKMGFREIGVRKQYYVEEGEDAILMEKTLRGIHGVV